MKSKRRILSLLALVLLFGVLFSMTVLPAFAHEENDSSSSSSSDKSETDGDSSSENKKEETPFQKWWGKYNQMIGYIVAGVVFVACSFGVYLWIKSALNSDKNKGKKPAKARNKQ